MKILLPVDGSTCSTRAAQFVANLANKATTLEVHLLNVQPLGDDWMIRRMIKIDELASLEQTWGTASLESARNLLTAAGVLTQAHIEQGEVAATIIRLADELGCNQIVMGSHGRSGLAGLLMGSVASKVMHLTTLPVTFIK